jgi:hypothetical protein
MHAGSREENDADHSLDSCILCGRIMVPGMDRRYKQIGDLTDLLKRQCNPTPFVYSSILSSNSPNDKRVCCCIACINWVRRIGKNDNNASDNPRKIPIPVDNLLLFLHCPGTSLVKPDQRSLHRMMCNLANMVIVVENTGERHVQNMYLKYCTPMMDR